MSPTEQIIQTWKTGDIRLGATATDEDLPPGCREDAKQAHTQQ